MIIGGRELSFGWLAIADQRLVNLLQESK